MSVYQIQNKGRATQIFFDGRKPVTISAGATAENVDLSDVIYRHVVRHHPELVFKSTEWSAETIEIAQAPTSSEGKPPIFIDGMWGIGDNIHQRAPIRELMKTNEVWLSTCHWHVYHDLVPLGLKLTFKRTRLRAQAKTIVREQGLFTEQCAPPREARHIKLWYKKPAIDVHGSIIETMMAECGVERIQPDFSLPIPDAWLAKADEILCQWNPHNRPIMIYRPIVRRREWNGESRNPDPAAYTPLYEAARQGYFTISIADLQQKEEWIVGPEQSADIKVHKGELDFETMAAMVKRANLVFCNAGFMPVLAQAVGTPSIVVYGGRESFRTTQRAGAHLAPTLGIDPINPCDCHTEHHPCKKEIDVPAALAKVKDFSSKYHAATKTHERPEVEPRPPASFCSSERWSRLTDSGTKTLIYATTYVDSPDRQLLTEHWLSLHTALNPNCDFLLVDSASPLPFTRKGYQMPKNVEVFDFGDNIGHLSRGGKDGWGRAFCKGLDIAVERGYEYVAHIEGDSLFRLPVGPIVEQMKSDRLKVCSIPVRGMTTDMPGWVETGLMIFSTEWLKSSFFSRRYDWPIRGVRPTPELVIGRMIGVELTKMPWKGLRGDKGQITPETVPQLDLDWITHCHSHDADKSNVRAYDKFMELNLPDGRCLSSEQEGNGDNLRLPSVCAGIRRSDGTDRRDGSAASSGQVRDGRDGGLRDAEETQSNSARPAPAEIRAENHPVEEDLQPQGACLPAIADTSVVAVSQAESFGDGKIIYDGMNSGAAKDEQTSWPLNNPSAYSVNIAAIENVRLVPHGLYLNLGCGENKLPKPWVNHDADVDITKPLPWPDASASFIFIEHCVEHVSYHQAIRFFEEAYRVLEPGGVFRIVVPSVEYISERATPAYFEFTKKWGGEATLKGAERAIRFSHGHQMGWTASLMRCELGYAGFEKITEQVPGSSSIQELRGVEGHGKIIGDAFNYIESLVFEGTRPTRATIQSAAHLPDAAVGGTTLPTSHAHQEVAANCRVAIIVGGAECVFDDLKAADALVAATGAQPTYFVINDQIATFERPCVAVTLHHPKLVMPGGQGWLDSRRSKGLPEPSDVWAHRQHPPHVTRHDTEHGHGSSGLFAALIARKHYGFERIILCGVPMRQEDKHFVRHTPWNACLTFRRHWEAHKAALAPFLRSLSGWTAETFGIPTNEFLARSA